MSDAKKWEWSTDPTETNILRDLRAQSLLKFDIIWINIF